MQDEYNNLVIKNDELPKNALGVKISLKNDAAVSEAVSVSETSAKVIEESGSTKTAKVNAAKSAGIKSISSAVSSVTVTASAATIAAAVVVVAAATSSGVTAPNAMVTRAGVNYYDGENIRVEFVLEDADGELESYYAWIEDADGAEITCEITAENGVLYAEAALIEETGGELYFVVYGASGGGWSGELYRGLLALPSAPEVSVEYTVDFDSESSALTITYGISGESRLSGYTAHIFDNSGEIESVADYAANTITATLADNTAEIYFVINGETSDGWSGEIFNGAIAIPTAPDLSVSHSAIYSAGSRELTVNFEISDTSALTSYTAKLYDSGGNAVECTVDYDTNAITAAMEDGTDVLNLVIEAVSADGWTGTLYSAEIDLSSLAPTVEVTGAAVTLYSDETNLTVQFTIDDPDGELAYHKVIIADVSGGEVSCSPSIDGSVYTATADISSLDTSGGLTLIVYVISNTGWDGNLYSGAITLPSKPDVTADVLLDTGYISGSGGEVYADIYYAGDTSGISAYEYWFEDMDGNKYACEWVEDYEGGTKYMAAFAATDSPSFDESGNLYFVISVTAADGWQGEIYRELLNVDYSAG